MKKLVLLLCLFCLFYIPYSGFWSYPHQFVIWNNTSHSIIIHDSGLSNHKALDKRIIINAKGGSHGDVNALTMQYGFFKKPDTMALVLQKANQSCKKISFTHRQDCKYTPISDEVERFTLDLNAMRHSDIGKKSGKWCGVFCGRNVLRTIITINPDSSPNKISINLSKSNVGGAQWH